MNDIDRILDAAANRCREGLRVVEDFVRFALDDAHLSRRLKELRHAFRETLSLLPGDRMLAARDTHGDVGTGIRTPAEQERRSAADVARAGCKRVEEALRTLEEYSKPLHVEAAAQFEQLRYRFYSLEQALLNTFRSRERLEHARLYLLTSVQALPHNGSDADAFIREVLRGGVDVIQLREKGVSDRLFLDAARRVRELTAEAGALFVVNDRPDIAVASRADGVHLGQEDLPVREARQIVGGDVLIGISTHQLSQAEQAVLDGADYLGVGPVFPSQTKHFAEFPGLDFVRQVAQGVRLPWFPLGGITEENIGQVLAAGASRVAVSAAITSVADPGPAATRLASAITDSD